MSLYQAHNSLAKRSFNSVIYTDFVFENHFHKNIEFVFVLDGEVLLTVGDKTEALKKGRAAVIAPMQAHSFSTPSASKVWVGVFTRDYVEEFCSFIEGRGGDKLSFRMPSYEYMHNQIEALSDSNQFEIKSFLYHICGVYIKKISFCEPKKQSTDILTRVLDYISRNFLEDITLASVSEALGYELHYLSRIFNEHLGQNFRSVVNGYRIDHAKLLLKKGDMTVSEVALNSGFSCIRSFNRAFLQLTGTTPVTYLKNI